MPGFKESLKEAVRQLAYRTSLDSLKKKGVQQVNVLGIDRVVGLVEAAVHRSLRSRLAGIEREAVAAAPQAESARLLRSNEGRQLKLAQDSVELANRYDGENAVIARRVSEVVRALAELPDLPVSVVEERLVEVVMDVVTRERESAEAARRELQDREVHNLQRRIKKLNDSLTMTEHRLQQVSALHSVDAGISSIYREVQGVDERDGQAGKKKELMAESFRANLQLQKRGKGA